MRTYTPEQLVDYLCSIDKDETKIDNALEQWLMKEAEKFFRRSSRDDEAEQMPMVTNEDELEVLDFDTFEKSLKPETTHEEIARRENALAVIAPFRAEAEIERMYNVFVDLFSDEFVIVRDDSVSIDVEAVASKHEFPNGDAMMKFLNRQIENLKKLLAGQTVKKRGGSKKGVKKKRERFVPSLSSYSQITSASK